VLEWEPMKATRRKFIKTGVSLGVGLSVAQICGKSFAQKDRPNILLILVDQDRYPAHTPPLNRPTLDRLKKNGLEFKNAFCAYPLCSPSRATILTGKYPHQAGVLCNIDTTQKNPSLSPKIPNLATVFSGAGYQTAYFGKWHLTRRPHSSGDFKRYGFDDIKIFNQAVGFGSDQKVIGEAAQWIERQKNQARPWLMICSVINPHDICFPGLAKLYGEIPEYPVSVPPNFIEDAGKIYPPLAGAMAAYAKTNRVPKDETGWLEYLRFYCYLTELIDRQLGSLLDSLQGNGQDQNTIVIYTADHGEMGGSHGLVNKSHTMFEETIHIPLVLNSPMLFQGARNYDGLVSHLDLVPTLAGIAGVKWPEPLMGRDLSLLACGKNAPEREMIFCEGQGEMKSTPPWRGLRTRNWKYWHYLDGAEFLFDLQTDPGEISNLAGGKSFQEINFEFRSKVRGFRLETQDPFKEFL